MSGGLLLLLFIVAFVGICIWQFIETRNALATTSVTSRQPPQQCAQLIGTSFEGARSLLWTRVAGPGTINMRRRGYKGGITMSITIEPMENGGTRVDMWASRYFEYMFVLANFAGVVNRRKRTLGRILTEPAPQLGVGSDPSQRVDRSDAYGSHSS